MLILIRPRPTFLQRAHTAAATPSLIPPTTTAVATSKKLWRLATAAFSTMTAPTTTTNNKTSNSSSSSTTAATAPRLPPPASPWCCVASWSSKDSIHLERISGYEEHSHLKLLQEKIDGVRSLDITTSPDWMEYIELLENRAHDSGGAGAYDTYRCDLILDKNAADSQQQDNNNGQWRIWGQDFHLNRLQESYRSIDPFSNSNDNPPEVVVDCINGEHQEEENKQALEDARKKSKLLVSALLEEAENAHMLQQKPTDNIQHDVSIQLLRITLLWSPPLHNPHHHGPSDDTDNNSDNDKDAIVVRAHACCSAVPRAVHRTVSPIQVTVAAKHQEKKSHAVAVDTSMPTRLRDPQHKIASWTRLRKKMERPETYKPAGVSEVLMLRPITTATQDQPAVAETEVLEGLSSNVFVVYQDGTLRTAHDGVLYGYARHLVLDNAQACGLKVDTTHPIVLQDAEKGLWKEAFITSSSRLIFPISKVLMHMDDEQNFEEYWRDPVLCGEETLPVGEKPKWQLLLDRILEKGGYPPPRSG